MSRQGVPPTTCLVCSLAIPEERRARRAMTCSKACEQRRAAEQYRRANKGRPDVTPWAMQALAIRAVESTLIQRGWETWSSTSDHCACRLIARRPSEVGPASREFVLVEVVTGHWSASGRSLIYPKRDPQAYDHLAVVVWPEVRFEPAL